MADKPRLLDLCCCAGGASAGYSKAGFDVEGVDNEPQPHYPFPFHLADALTYPLEGFDAYHASPPCQGYSVCQNMTNVFSDNVHPKILGEIRARLIATGKPWVIENVVNAKFNATKLPEGVQGGLLCGTMFGMPFYRHRLFETSFPWFSPGHPKHRLINAGSYGAGVKSDAATLMHNLKVVRVSAAKYFDTEWMNGDELSEAIPTCYTEYIGKYLMAEVLKQARLTTG